MKISPFIENGAGFNDMIKVVGIKQTQSRCHCEEHRDSQ